MSFVSAQPAELTAAAENLKGIGLTLATQNVAAAAPTTGCPQRRTRSPL